MDQTEQKLINWLETGFTQSPDRISELFYFDKNNLTFFSILVTDYFLVDENLNKAVDTTSTYSTESLNFLIDKMRRIEIGDPSILAISRLGNIDNELEILSHIDSFLNLNAIDLGSCQLWLPEDGSVTISIQCN